MAFLFTLPGKKCPSSLPDSRKTQPVSKPLTDEPGSKLLVLGMVIQPLIGNPYNGYINPYYWVDDHPLLCGNNGSLDPIAQNYRKLGCFFLGFPVFAGQNRVTSPLRCCSSRWTPFVPSGDHPLIRSLWILTFLGANPGDFIVKFFVAFPPKRLWWKNTVITGLLIFIVKKCG